MAYIVVCLASQLHEKVQEQVGRLFRNDAVLLELPDVFLHLVDEPLAVARGDQHLDARHGLCLLEGLGHLGHRLLNILLLSQQLLARLVFGVRVQTFPDLGHAPLHVAQAEEGGGRDGEVRRDVTGLHLDDVLQVAHALLDLALLEAAVGPQFSQARRAVGRHDGLARVYDALVPLVRRRRLLSQAGGTLGLEQLVELGGPGRLFGQGILLLSALPVGALRLDLAQLQMGALEAGPQLQHLVEVVGGLRGAAERQVGGGALEIGQVVGRVARHGGIVVNEGVARLALGEVRVRRRQQRRDRGVGRDVGGGQGVDEPRRREQAGGHNGQRRQRDQHGGLPREQTDQLGQRMGGESTADVPAYAVEYGM